MIVESLIILLFIFGLVVTLTGTTLAKTDSDRPSSFWFSGLWDLVRVEVQ